VGKAREDFLLFKYHTENLLIAVWHGLIIKYIGETVPVVPINWWQYMLKNRQCTAMLAAPIMGHDVIFTLFGVFIFSAFFH